MGVCEAKVTLGATSALPEDSVVNVFHFANSDEALLVTNALTAFYTATPTGQGASISAFMSGELSRAALAAKVDLYDLADPEPRVPFGGGSFTLDAPISSQNIPAEAAVCVSWLAEVESGVPAGRRRGRNFIGPLTIGAVENIGTARPSATFTGILVAAAVDLVNQVDPACPLVIWSRASTPPVARPVVAGYVDNAFDTMRSRGPDTTARTTF